MTWAHYLLQVNLYLVIFYVFYKLLLEKETWFMLNRLYLIASGLLSLTIPFLRPEWFARQPVSHRIQVSVDQLNIMVEQISDPANHAGYFNWAKLLTDGYIVIVSVLLIRFILQLFVVKKLIRMKSPGAAFSFFKHKVIDTTMPSLEVIEKHEDIHIRQLHTLDVLFFEILGIFIWFNPILYFYKIAIKNIHEYLADEEAADFQGDKESYAMLLLANAFHIDQNVLTNSFYNKSLIKKRIFMLHKERSKRTAILKYGLFLPLFAITLLFSSASIRKNEEIIDLAEKISLSTAGNIAENVLVKTPVIIDKRVAASVRIFPPPPPIDSKSSVKELIKEQPEPPVLPPTEKDQTVYDFVSVSRQPTFVGGMDKFYTYIGNAVKYPQQALKNNKEGKVYLNFIVEKNGELSDIRVVRALGDGTDEEAIRVLKESPKWIPGIAEGRPVRVRYNIPIKFTINPEDQPTTERTAPIVAAALTP